MSASDVLHWLVDHTTKNGAVSPEQVAELHASVDEDVAPAPAASKKGKADDQ